MPEKFIVPQFIDKEDQILGPVTVRQFLIVLATLFNIFIASRILAIPYFIAYGLISAGLGATFAFLKINAQPFHIFFINFLQTILRPQLRVWDKRYTDAELRAYAKVDVAPPTQVRSVKHRPETSRLRDLSLIVNTGGVYKPDDESF